MAEGNDVLEAVERGLGFSLEQLKTGMGERHGTGEMEGYRESGYACKGAHNVQIRKFEAAYVSGLARMGLDFFLVQGQPEVEEIRLLAEWKVYASGTSRIAVQGIDVDSLWEQGNFMAKVDEGLKHTGYTANLSLPSRFLATSKCRSPTVPQATLFLLIVAGCATATWEDFANNLGSDLAPLLALFGEQVTKQYLSESYSLLDSFVFALAPLGIITAMVAAIRVGGNTNFRSLIGRATESRGTVEADLMSSTSADVCELWNGQGVVRVLGSPVLLQLVYVESEKAEAKAGIYTLPEAVNDGFYEGPTPNAGQDLDTEAFLARQNPPSLSLNASINIERRRPMAEAIALVSVLLQGSVLVFSGLVQYKPGILKGNKPIGYGFPMFLAGTLGLAVGMFLCAQVVELSTDETIYKPSKKLIAGGSGTEDRNTVIWLQQGGQTVGDQLFESFARRRSTTTIMTSKKSDRDRNSLVIIAISTALFGFIAQFVGLRAMHATVTVVQLGVVLAMTALRSFAHMQRENRNDIKSPKQVDGCELDWLAKNFNECESWEVTTEFDRSTSCEESSNLAMGVVKSCARLATLSEDWILENRNGVKALQSAIEETINFAFAQMTIKDDSGDTAEFKWCLPVKVKFRGEESVFPVTLSLKRQKDDNGNWKAWKADRSELEAVLCLWTSSLTEAKRKRAQDGEPALKCVRLLGLATDESKIDYGLWTYRETTYDEVPAPLAIPSPTSSEVQYFGWTEVFEDVDGQENSKVAKYICIGCEGGHEKLCIQDLYGWFIFSLARVIGEVGGDVTRGLNDLASEQSAVATQSNGWDKFRLINSNLNSIATIFSESGIGIIEDAYSYIIPAFRLAGNLPFPHEAYSGARVEAQRLEDEGLWEQALEIDLWLYRNSRKTRASRLDISLITIEIRGRLRRLAERLFVERAKEGIDSDLSQIWDAVYSGWETIQEASEDRVVSLLNLSITCSKFKPEMDESQIFLVALDAAREVDVRVLRIADVVLDWARFYFENGLLDNAETLARLVWTKTIIPWPCREGTRNKEAGALLMSVRQRKGTSLLHNEHKLSVYLSNPESMQLATRTGISIAVNILDIKEGHVPIEILVIQGSRTLLQWAAENEQEIIVRQLLKADVKEKEVPAEKGGRTALQAAAEGGHESIVKLLLEAKAEVNAVLAKYGGGRTALQAAAGGGHESIVKLLLEAKAEVNAAPAEYGGRTALQAAAGGGHESIVKLLLEAEAEVNAAPAASYGRTALQAAAGGGHESIVKLLLEANAAVTSTETGQARRAGHLRILGLLEQKQNQTSG